MPAFVTVILSHTPPSLKGRSVGTALASVDRTPDRLADAHGRWEREPALLRNAPPSMVFAAIGQARADGRITPEQESRSLAGLLTYWALRSATDAHWAVRGAPSLTNPNRQPTHLGA
jgi:hypothetical protein